MQIQQKKHLPWETYPVSDRTEERMDMARYRCRIYHMYSIVCEGLYEDMAMYRSMVAGGHPSVAFIKPLASGNVECVVYVFAAAAARLQFLQENPDYNKLYKLTKERKVL